VADAARVLAAQVAAVPAGLLDQAVLYRCNPSKTDRSAGHRNTWDDMRTRTEVPYYWGYTVSAEKRSFARLLEKGKFDLIIATSKIGAKIAEKYAQIAEKWAKACTILVGFGAPTRGLNEIVKDEGVHLNSLVDFVVNTIPSQGTETVRTEEAIVASLAILNVNFYY